MYISIPASLEVCIEYYNDTYNFRLSIKLVLPDSFIMLICSNLFLISGKVSVHCEGHKLEVTTLRISCG